MQTEKEQLWEGVLGLPMVIEQNKMTVQPRPLRRVSQRLGRKIRTLESPASQVTKVSQRIGKQKEEEGKNRGMI